MIDKFTRSLRAVSCVLAGLGLASATVLASVTPVAAQRASIVGTWNGGGTVVFPSGQKENARCRATFRPQGRSYSMYAVCATPSARVVQTADVVRTGSNSFRGDFFNSEFGVSGSISIRLSGSSLRASLSGGGGTAYFSLSR